MKDHDPILDSPHLQSPRVSRGAMSSERVDPSRALMGSIVQRRMHVAGRTLVSLLLGGVAVLGSILVFRQGLLPLIEAAFHLGPEWLSVFRRIGIPLTAVGGY